jgi:hypothetical protein
MKRVSTFLTLLSFCLLCAVQANGQRISFDYRQVPLQDVLRDLQERYDLRFSYSRDLIPLEQRIRAQARELPLADALDELFAETSVVFAIIGTQIALKTDPSKKPERRYGQAPPPASKPQITPQEETGELTEAPAPDTLSAANLAQIERMPSLPPDDVYSSRSGVSVNLPDLSFLDSLDVGRASHQRLAQVSFAPMLGSNGLSSPNLVNNFSLNFLWGYNGGVEGVELGGLGNSVLLDVRGVQVGGLGNTVGRDMTGTQAAGWFNYVGREVRGVQLSGLFNYGEADVYGLQASGLFNYSGGSGGHASQVAGLANYSEGRVHAQVAGLFNRAHTVTGLQLGLVNVADTVSGASIGLLNFVRRGYNRVEVSGSEALLLQAGVKFGSQRFYNIVQSGARWSGGFDPVALEVLAIGYGIGTRQAIRKRWGINHELVSMHLFEGGWTSELNLLNQFRWSIDFRFDKRRTLFAGFSFNALASERQHPETGARGSGLPPYTWIETSLGSIHWQLWMGFSGGIRF